MRARLRPRIFQLAERASGLAEIGRHEHASRLAVIDKIPLNLRGKKRGWGGRLRGVFWLYLCMNLFA